MYSLPPTFCLLKAEGLPPPLAIPTPTAELFFQTICVNGDAFIVNLGSAQSKNLTAPYHLTAQALAMFPPALWLQTSCPYVEFGSIFSIPSLAIFCAHWLATLFSSSESVKSDDWCNRRNLFISAIRSRTSCSEKKLHLACKALSLLGKWEEMPYFFKLEQFCCYSFLLPVYQTFPSYQRSRLMFVSGVYFLKELWCCVGRE